MSPISALSSAVAKQRKTFRGDLLLPDTSGYDETRRIHNGLIDKRPALIARCRTAADIVAAIGLARAQGLEIAVRGGVISTTGIAGLTLGGGLGWTMGSYGMAVDNLSSAEIVTADGRVLTASPYENADLFWAVRGGGGNFGVAASLEYRLHPLREVVGGLAAHPLARARDVLRFYRDVTASAPDDLTIFAGLVHAPDGSGAKLAALAVCHCGPQAVAQAAVAPIKQFGPPVMDMVGPMPYEQQNQMLDGAFPRGALNYWKSHFLSALSDDAIDCMVERFEGCPAPLGALMLEHFHGATTRVDVSETAFPHREVSYNFLSISQWLDPAHTAACTAWARETYSAMQPFLAARAYVNYLGDDETGDPVAAAYGPNFERLRDLKAKYDPSNVFRLNQNIRPRS